MLVVVCSDEHFINVEDAYGKMQQRNAILDTVRSELKMDHFYIVSSHTILVRVNLETLDNQILREN